MAPSFSSDVDLSGVEFKLAGIEVESEVLQQRVLQCCEALAAGHAWPQGGDASSLLRAAEEALQSMAAIVHSLCEENLVLERRTREEGARSTGLEAALMELRGELDDGSESSPQTQPDGGWSVVLEEPSFANSFVAAPDPDRQQCEQVPRSETSSASSGGIPEQLRSIVAALEQAQLAYGRQQDARAKEPDGFHQVREARTQTVLETSWEGAKQAASLETSWEPTASWEPARSWEPAKKSQGRAEQRLDSEVQSPCHWSVSTAASSTAGKEQDPLQLAMESLHQTKAAVAVKSSRSLGRHL